MKNRCRGEETPGQERKEGGYVVDESRRKRQCDGGSGSEGVVVRRLCGKLKVGRVFCWEVQEETMEG